MAIPEGYTKLGLVGYSDKGTYTAEATYNRYNVVLHNGSTYVALKDGLTGVEPSDDKVNWKYFARGFEAEMASEITAVDKYNIAGGTPDPTGASTTEVMLQLLLDKYSDQIVNKLVSNEGFQQKLMDYIINNGATNQEGYAADARQLNPNIEGSLAKQVSELNANANSYVISAAQFNINSMPLPVAGQVKFYHIANASDGVFPGNFGTVIIMPTSWNASEPPEALAIFFGATSEFVQYSTNHFINGAWQGWKKP